MILVYAKQVYLVSLNMSSKYTVTPNVRYNEKMSYDFCAGLPSIIALFVSRLYRVCKLVVK